ncbi:hypothetical protein LTR36_004654 [Oleoguttula mirabilis]|uniref:Uncharacterized protein n=1 Tax=Oleoguttula mirabilis TaxID=1507867 RepID=A0AAV9JFQ9_9PEZI|nr:hypothetical protein LTR36_004654 [Oleoguttula mirabilis]
MAPNDAPNDQPAKSAAVAICHLLKLPPELRNTIYELAFTTAADLGEPINIVRACGPSPSLVLTCRQVHSESSAIFNVSQDRYWAVGKFELHAQSSEDADEAVIASLEASVMEDVTNFTLYLDFSGALQQPRTRQWELLRNGWKLHDRWAEGFREAIAYCDVREGGWTRHATQAELDMASTVFARVSLRDQICCILGIESRTWS